LGLRLGLRLELGLELGLLLAASDSCLLTATSLLAQDIDR
jgi:hypothetical protein